MGMGFGIGYEQEILLDGDTYAFSDKVFDEIWKIRKNYYRLSE